MNSGKKVLCAAGRDMAQRTNTIIVIVRSGELMEETMSASDLTAFTLSTVTFHDRGGGSAWR